MEVLSRQRRTCAEWFESMDMQVTYPFDIFSRLEWGLIAGAFCLALVLTYVVRTTTRWLGIVAKPRSDRWHKKPTALLGGVAIFLTGVIIFACHPPESQRSWVVLGASAFLFVIGLIDDFLHIKPYQKLIGQIVGAAFVVANGLSLAWTGAVPVDMVITIFWIIGITNALNLLDNMDGLAGGIAVIASVFLGLNLASNGLSNEAWILAVFSAAALGFLVFNSYPATIFMGDCGSLLIGFFLASASLLSTQGERTRTLLPVLAVPVLILFVPIFDTTFVTILRKVSGRAASQGGRDHTSHRLVALGLSERRAVWMLYGLAALSGVLALFVCRLALDLSIALVMAFTIMLSLVGVYLAGVKVYDPEEVRAAQSKPLMAFLIKLSYKRRAFEVLLDVVLIVLAYYISYWMYFGPIEDSSTWQTFAKIVPVMVVIKLGVFLLFGLYRGIWRYISVEDVVLYLKAVGFGSLACVSVFLLAFRFEGLSRTVFFTDGIVLFLMVTSSRIAFRLFRRLLPMTPPHDGSRILIYGAGDSGVLLLRQFKSNSDHQLIPVGFIDDDPLKHGCSIQGLRVFAGNGRLVDTCRKQRIDEIVISSSKFDSERVQEILKDCDSIGVTLRRMRIEIETLSSSENA